jgi:hypothetical protein
MSLESDSGMILTGENRRTRRKTCPSATLSTTNPIWICPGTNPGLSGETWAIARPYYCHIHDAQAKNLASKVMQFLLPSSKHCLAPAQTGDPYKSQTGGHQLRTKSLTASAEDYCILCAMLVDWSSRYNTDTQSNGHVSMEIQYLIISCLVWRYHGDISICTKLKYKISNSFIVICCFVETMRWNNILFNYPWPTTYMYFYTTQQSRLH